MSICLFRYATQESKIILKIVQSLKTSSCGNREALGLSKNVFGITSFFSGGVWGKAPLGKTWRTLNRVDGVNLKGGRSQSYFGQRLESHTKTLMERVFPRNQLKPLAKMARGLGSGLRPHLMKRGLGGDGGFERLCLENGVLGVSPIGLTKANGDERNEYLLHSFIQKYLSLLKNIKILVIIPLCAEKVLYLHSNFEK